MLSVIKIHNVIGWLIMALIIKIIICFLVTIQATVIFTIYDSSHSLEELIGSVHHHTNDLKVIVFGYSSQNISKNDITLWRHVRFIDIQHEIKYSTKNSATDDDLEILKAHLFEYIFEEELVDKAIFIQSGFLFDKKLLKIKNGVGIGFEVYTKTGGYEENVKQKLAIFRGLNNEVVKKPMLHQHLKLPRVSNDSKWSCSIKIRSELIFSGLLSRTDRDTNSSVALLVPVKSQNDQVEDCALLKYLIPSVTSTCALNNVSLYVGYDVDDPVFKDQSKRDHVKNKTSLQVKFYELPRTGGWLTFIWSFLFVEAFKDGNEYFVQLNDDVKFLKSGWLSSSISMLPKEERGVVGFNDIMWQCKLYTQTLVNRNHYKIFKGQYFPLSLRNWYSDNWITSVYGNRGGTCNKDALISNSNVETRYKPCDSRNYKRVLKKGKELILMK